MAEAALRAGEDFGLGKDFDTDIVRRLMARPIRTGTGPKLADVVPVRRATVPEASVVDDTASLADMANLRSQVMVMKAVLRAEREDAAQLRASVERLAGPAPISPEACAVRDRWAAIVDQLLDGQR